MWIGVGRTGAGGPWRGGYSFCVGNYRIFCSMVIYPVIPKGMVIFRIVSTAAHTMEDVEYTLNAFKEIKAKLDAGEYDGDDVAAMTIE